MIGQKIINIMSEIEAIPKTELDEEKNYKFAKSEEIIAMVKPLLVKYKVIILPVKVTNFTPQGNKVFITMKYQFIDVEDPNKESIEVEIPGGGFDEKGRAVFAALTGAYRYAMQEVFAIPIVDEIKNINADSDNQDSECDDSSEEIIDNPENNNLENEMIDNMSPDDIDKLFYSKTA